MRYWRGQKRANELVAHSSESIGSGIAYGGISIEAGALDGRKRVGRARNEHAEGLDGHQPKISIAILCGVN